MTSPIETTPAKAPKTIEDWLAEPEERRLELIDGELIEKAAPDFSHGRTQRRLGTVIDGYDRKPGGPGGPGGWWIGTEIDLVMDGRGFRPDIAGWRREQMPVPPKTRPVTVRPDWICEIVIDSNRTTDTIKKLRRYHQSGVQHYWILDQMDRTLSVYRHGPDGYVVALRADTTEKVRAEPFDAVELSVAELFGDDAE